VSVVEANAPKVLWAIDFQFDSTIDGAAIKIASMIDEPARVSLLHMVERSVTPSGSSTHSSACSPRPAGRRKVLWRDIGPELVYQALQQSGAGKIGVDLHSTRYAVE
jgi:putative transposase